MVNYVSGMSFMLSFKLEFANFTYYTFIKAVRPQFAELDVLIYCRVD
jgi:hypothetical protein